MFLKGIQLMKDRVVQTDEYPFDIPSIGTFEEMELESPITFFVGENGSGKSTLLEAIADQCGFNTAGGGRNHFYEVDSSDSALGAFLRLSWMPKATNGFFLRAESFYHFASYLDEVDDTGFAGYGGKSLHHQSHGESFMSLFSNRFQGKALYLLDEPEAALSPQRQLTFLRILKELSEERGCQFIIATHSPILLAYPGAAIHEFSEDGIAKVDYEDTEHYRITKYFMDHRESFLRRILED